MPLSLGKERKGEGKSRKREWKEAGKWELGPREGDAEQRGS
jgi:hypothetical protein